MAGAHGSRTHRATPGAAPDGFEDREGHRPLPAPRAGADDTRVWQRSGVQLQLARDAPGRPRTGRRSTPPRFRFARRTRTGSQPTARPARQRPPRPGSRVNRPRSRTRARAGRTRHRPDPPSRPRVRGRPAPRSRCGWSGRTSRRRCRWCRSRPGRGRGMPTSGRARPRSPPCRLVHVDCWVPSARAGGAAVNERASGSCAACPFRMDAATATDSERRLEGGGPRSRGRPLSSRCRQRRRRSARSRSRSPRRPRDSPSPRPALPPRLDRRSGRARREPAARRSIACPASECGSRPWPARRGAGRAHGRQLRLRPAHSRATPGWPARWCRYRLVLARLGDRGHRGGRIGRGRARGDRGPGHAGRGGAGQPMTAPSHVSGSAASAPLSVILTSLGPLDAA